MPIIRRACRAARLIAILRAIRIAQVDQAQKAILAQTARLVLSPTQIPLAHLIQDLRRIRKVAQAQDPKVAQVRVQPRTQAQDLRPSLVAVRLRNPHLKVVQVAHLLREAPAQVAVDLHLGRQQGRRLRKMT